MGDLIFVDLRLSLRLDTDLDNPYALFGLKGGFEKTFRKMTGCFLAECHGCAQTPDCAGHHAFGRTLATDPAALRRYQKPSVPFILSPPVLPDLPNCGSVVEMGLVLLGGAADHLSLYVRALRSLLLRRQCALIKIESLNYGGQRSRIDGGNEQSFSGHLHLLSLQGLHQTILLPPQEILLTFATPLCLLQDGKPLRQLDFTSFVRPLLRRVSSLVYYYGGSDLDQDFKWLARLSEEVESDAAEVAWRSWGGEKGVRWSGLLGRCAFRGNLAEFHPFLLFGEYLQLGKGCPWGFGRYVLHK